MKKYLLPTALALLVAAALPLKAADAPSDAKPDKAKSVQKSRHHAAAQPTAPAATPAPKKKHGFFDSSELHKDRSLPSDDKVPPIDSTKSSSPPPYKNLGKELHKDRG